MILARSRLSVHNKSIAAFSGALWVPTHERAISDRVMSTSTWPVPYY